MLNKDILKGLSSEQIAKARNCKNPEELLKLAKEEGIELTEEQLESVSGGLCSKKPGPPCPKCGGTNTFRDGDFSSDVIYICVDCMTNFEPWK